MLCLYVIKTFFYTKINLKILEILKNDNYIPIVDNKKKIINIRIVNSNNNKVSAALIAAGGKGKKDFIHSQNIFLNL